MTYRSLIPLLLGAFALGLIVTIGVVSGSLAADALSLGNGMPRLIVISCGVFFMLWLGKRPIAGRYSLEASQEIAAPVETVWDAVYPRTRYEYFSTTIDAVSAVSGEPDTYRYSLSAIEEGGSFTARVIKCNRFEGFVMEVLGSDINETFTAKYERVFYTFEAMEDGLTLMGIREEIRDLSLIGLILLKASNPPRDCLLQLKAYCEGSRDRSYASWLMRP